MAENNPVNYTGSESAEPQVWTTDLRKRPNRTTAKHIPCGHWHKRKVSATPTDELTFVDNPTYQGRWVYPTTRFNTHYMYILEIDPRNTTLGEYGNGITSVVKVDLSASPPIATERLVLNSTYCGTFDPFRLLPAQRGPFCINKSGTRLFYLLRNYDYHWVAGYSPDRHAELIEVDITGTYMETVKKTILTDFFTLNTHVVNDCCADDDYSYWSLSDSTGRIVKIANGTHTIAQDYSIGVASTASIDCEGDYLYWAYKTASYVSSFIRSDKSFNIITNQVITQEPGRLFRIFDSILYASVERNSLLYRNPILKYDTDWVRDTGFYWIDGNIDYMQQIFGVRSGNLYILHMHPNTTGSNYLHCIDKNVGTDIADKSISYWAGHGSGSFDWCWSSMAVIDPLSDVIAHLRYKESDVNTGPTGLYKNWLATFSADSGFTELTDSAIDYPTYSHY
jgi:hypothetical protein